MTTVERRHQDHPGACLGRAGRRLALPAVGRRAPPGCATSTQAGPSVGHAHPPLGGRLAGRDRRRHRDPRVRAARAGSSCAPRPGRSSARPTWSSSSSAQGAGTRVRDERGRGHSGPARWCPSRSARPRSSGATSRACVGSRSWPNVGRDPRDVRRRRHRRRTQRARRREPPRRRRLVGARARGAARRSAAPCAAPTTCTPASCTTPSARSTRWRRPRRRCGPSTSRSTAWSGGTRPRCSATRSPTGHWALLAPRPRRHRRAGSTSSTPATARPGWSCARQWDVIGDQLVGACSTPFPPVRAGARRPAPAAAGRRAAASSGSCSRRSTELGRAAVRAARRPASCWPATPATPTSRSTRPARG